MKMLEGIFNSTLNFLGNSIFDLFKTSLNLTVFILILIVILLLFMRKKRVKVKKMIFTVAIVTLALIMFLVFPFIRGVDINNLQTVGLELVSCIENIKQEKGDYPRTLDEILTLCSIANSNSIPNSYKYVYIDSKSTNEKNKNDKGFEFLTSNSYRLYINSKIIKPDNMYYDQNLGKFIWSD